MDLTERYMHEVPMEYLHQGYKALLCSPDGERILATIEMDGLAVSATYGRRAGNIPICDDPEKNYINVRFRVCEVQEAEHRPHCLSTTVYERDGWKFLLDKDGQWQYEADLEIDRFGAEVRERREARQKVEARILAAQQMMADAQRELAMLNVEQATD